MTNEQATALVDLIDQLAKDRAFEAVCHHEDDYDTRGDTVSIKAKLAALLRDLP